MRFVGSSVSESSRDGDDGAVPGGYGYEEGPPGYSHTNGHGEKLGEVGENGYPVRISYLTTSTQPQT